MEVTGRIEKILELQGGTSKSGKDWKKQSFLLKTEQEYNNLYCFEVFGEDKVDNLTKFNKVGDNVKVIFNVKTNEWQGKYFTALEAWRIEKVAVEGKAEAPEVKEEVVDDLPF